MSKLLKRSVIGLLTSIAIALVFLISFVCFPGALYSVKTKVAQHTVYHSAVLDPELIQQIKNADALVQDAEFYDPSLAIEFCLNDGSWYPKLLAFLRAPAFAWGFYDKVVLQGNLFPSNNNLEFRDYKWNLKELLAHEMMHCYQFNKLGFWHCNPVANIPEWKFEGYPEYCARRSISCADLRVDITRMYCDTLINSNTWAIYFPDSTIAPKAYYQSWILVKYCLEKKGMKYSDLLKDTTSMETVNSELQHWYAQNQ